MDRFLGLLLLLHLHRLISGAQQAMPQQSTPKPMAPQRPSTAFSGGAPSAQGGHGLGQGYHGAMGLFGGLGSMQNTLGQLPHQQPQSNPWKLL